MNANGGHFLKEDLSRFDSKFFGISPVEAKVYCRGFYLQDED